MSDSGAPTVRFQHLDDVPYREVKSQLHPDGRRVSVWIRFLEQSDERALYHTHYDPGLVLERHGHASDHYVFVLSGEVRFGDEVCRAGSLISLPFGATFGPIVVGDEGADIFEIYFGNSRPMPADPAEYLALLAEKGIERLPPPIVPGATDPADRPDT